MLLRRLLSCVGLLALVGAGSVAVPRSSADAAPPPSAAAGAKPIEPGAACARAFPGRGGKPTSSAGQGGTVSLAAWGDQVVAYVVHEDDRAIHAVDVRGKEVAVTALDGVPSSVLVMADGRVAVTLRDKSRLQLFEPGARPTDALSLRCSLAVPTEPVALAESRDGATLAVTSAWAHKLVAFDVASMKPRVEVDVAREPRAVVVDDAGERVFVAHVVDSKMSVVDLPTASSSLSEVRTIDLRAKRESVTQMGCQGFALAKSVSTLPASSGKPGAAASGERPLPSANAPPLAPKTPAPVAPLESRIFAPMVTVDPGDASAGISDGYGSPERGPTERPLVSVVDGGAERTLTRTAAGDMLQSREACLLPRAAAFDGGSQSLLVACLGSNVVLRLDGRAVDPSRRQIAAFRVASGPTGIAIDEKNRRAVVFSQFASKLTVIDLARGATTEVDVPVTAARMPTAAMLRGRELFHATSDPRISSDGRACASCHPDGRDDAITWQTPEGPRQTIMLAGRLGSSTAPFGWNGSNKTVKEHVTDTMVRLDGVGMTQVRDQADFDALITYVTSMQAPKLEIASARSALVKRGEELFHDETAACATCHHGGGTNGQAFEVTGEKIKVDTPSLRAVGGTAPYFHDGRFATLDALLASPDHSMGKTIQLTRKDRVALTAYLETL